MGTIADKLSKLTATKNAIKAALTGKGVTVSDNDTFASYADKIGEISDINPAWTDWRYFSYSNNRNDLVSKLKYTDTARGTNFSNMFYGCNSLAAVPEIDTAQGTSFSNMFYGCTSLASVPAIDTARGTSFNNMCQNCAALASVPAINTAQGTNFSYMFYGCRLLAAVPAINTARGTIFSSMFYGCTSLASVPAIDTAQGTNFNSMFSGCTKLAAAPPLDTSKGTSFSSMFYNCTSLASVPALDISKCTSTYDVFYNCAALENLALTGLVKTSGLNLSYSSKLSKASIASVINALDASVSGKSVTLSRTAVNAAFETAAGAKDGSASAEWQNLIAAKSNWTISLS